MRILLILVYGIIGIIIMNQFSVELDSMRPLTSSIIGLGTGIVCCILTIITDDIIARYKD